jgi:hypothetical protein
VFETIERWGDFGGCIALLLILYYYRDRSVPGGAPQPKPKPALN